MGLRPTNTNEGASGRCRGINNLDRAFNRAVIPVGVLAATTPGRLATVFGDPLAVTINDPDH